MASGLIGIQVPRKGLWVRVPCPPLLFPSPSRERTKVRTKRRILRVKPRPCRRFGTEFTGAFGPAASFRGYLAGPRVKPSRSLAGRGLVEFLFGHWTSHAACFLNVMLPIFLFVLLYDYGPHRNVQLEEFVV
jgi:hypothetical protein